MACMCTQCSHTVHPDSASLLRMLCLHIRCQYTLEPQYLVGSRLSRAQQLEIVPHRPSSATLRSVLTPMTMRIWVRRNGPCGFVFLVFLGQAAHIRLQCVMTALSTCDEVPNRTVRLDVHKSPDVYRNMFTGICSQAVRYVQVDAQLLQCSASAVASCTYSVMLSKKKVLCTSW